MVLCARRKAKSLFYYVSDVYYLGQLPATPETHACCCPSWYCCFHPAVNMTARAARRTKNSQVERRRRPEARTVCRSELWTLMLQPRGDKAYDNEFGSERSLASLRTTRWA